MSISVVAITRNPTIPSGNKSKLMKTEFVYRIVGKNSLPPALLPSRTKMMIKTIFERLSNTLDGLLFTDSTNSLLKWNRQIMYINNNDNITSLRFLYILSKRKIHFNKNPKLFIWWSWVNCKVFSPGKTFNFRFLKVSWTIFNSKTVLSCVWN